MYGGSAVSPWLVVLSSGKHIVLIEVLELVPQFIYRREEHLVGLHRDDRWGDEQRTIFSDDAEALPSQR
jgi:hypothetical protein